MSKSVPSKFAITRRNLLKTAAVGAAAGVAAPWFSRAVQAKPDSLTLVRESSYVPAFDAYFRNTIAPAYEKETGIKVNYETVAAGSPPPAVARNIAIVQSKAPVDLCWGYQEYLFRDAFLDVSDVAENVAKTQGGYYPGIVQISKWKGAWKSVPFGNIGQVMVYRKDWFEEAGIHKFPDTWDEFLEAAIKLKAKGHPFGMSMGHGYADNNSWLFPLLWSYGAEIVAKDGKTIHVDSAETAKCIDYVRKLYKEGCIEDCVGWGDPGNNKAFLTSQISCTNNAASILISAIQAMPDMGKVIDHAPNPKGPKGGYHSLVEVTHSIFNHTPDPAETKKFLGWLMDPKQATGWYESASMYYAPFTHHYDKSPAWDKEPRFRIYREIQKTARHRMYPAPLDLKAGQVLNTFIVTDMFAKACTGSSTQQAIAEAVAALKQIYG
jgi:multiple sugar transport system substrate-binding protein